MSSIIPIPTSRVGDYFVRQRLVQQVQSDDTDLFKLQSQVSTGQRLQLPSDDAPAALRAISLQRLLAQTTQIQTNVQSNTTMLTAADDALASASGLLNNVLGQAISSAGTTLSDSERQDAVNQVDQALEALVNLGNTQSAGQYLFSGSKTQVQPYEYNGQYVQYNGNDGASQTYVGVNRLFGSTLAGTDAFGGISTQAQGGALNPLVSSGTVLSTINAGQGIDKNPAISVSINTGTATVTSVIDLSKAVTVGDVARLIEQGVPAGTNITASINGSGLVLNTTSGTITVGEVGEGKAANELGIATPKNAAPVSTITGSPLNPVILKTTKLNSLLGTQAQAVLQSTGSNNDLVLTANSNGTALNNVGVVFANDGTAGAETANYDSTNKILIVHIQSGFSTASQVAAAINTQGTFQASPDYHDQSSAAQAGSGSVGAKNFGQITDGGSGQALDSAAGLIITNGGQTATIDTSGAKTVEDLLNEINGAGLGVVAEINSDSSGINVRSTLSGTGLTIGENGGQLASQLGLRTYNEDTKLSDFNGGLGAQASGALQQLDTSKLDSLKIVARNGTTLNVNLTGVTSLQGVADAINQATGNNAGGTAVNASVSSNGNRLELVDSSTGATGKLTVQAPTGNKAAQYLGLVPADATQNASTAQTTAAQAEGLLTLNTTGHATIILTAKSGGAAAGAEGQGTKTLQIVDGTTEGVTYNASTDTITATVNISGGHNTAGDLATVLNSSSDFAAAVSSGGTDTIAATNTGTAPLNGGLDAGSDTLSGNNVQGNDLVITARDGTKLYVDIGDAKTVKDVIDRINGNSANNSGTTKVVAQLATTGNGIELIDESTATTGPLTVESAEGSQAAEFLGFVPTGQTQATSTAGSGGNFVLQSADTHSIQAEGAFNTLIRLKQALQANDTEGIGQAITDLKTDISRVAFARSDTGTRLQSLDDITSNLKDQNVQLKSSLSDNLDTDMVQAISDLTGRQYSLQASLQTAASLLKLSLLNYI